MQAPVHYTQTASVGIYGIDDEGNHWTTVHTLSPDPDAGYGCAVCGKRIRGGYQRYIDRVADVVVCPEHVVWTGKES